MRSAVVLCLLVPTAALLSLAVRAGDAGRPSDCGEELRWFSEDWHGGDRWKAICRCITNDLDHLHGKPKKAVLQFLGKPDKEIDEVLLVYRCLWETNPSQAGDPGHGLRILVSLDAHGKVTGIEPSWVSAGQMPPEDIGRLSRPGE